MPENTKEPTPERLLQFLWGYSPPLIIDEALRCGIFDALSSKAKTLQELTEETGISARGARAVLNALVGIELLSQKEGMYALTPESRTFLVSHQPMYLGKLFHWNQGVALPRLLTLDAIVHEGKPLRSISDEEHGAEFFLQNAEAVFPLDFPAAQELVRIFDVANLKEEWSVLDIGTGSGVMGIPMAQASPHVRVRAVDWTTVLELTQRITKQFGVADQFELVGGDDLEADFGKNHQLAVLGQLLHSEGETRSQKLLQRTYDALAPGGVVAILELVPNDDRTGPPGPLLFSVLMLAFTDHGDTFTFQEIKSWLDACGFEDAKRVEMGPHTMILANKPR